MRNETYLKSLLGEDSEDLDSSVVYAAAGWHWNVFCFYVRRTAVLWTFTDQPPASPLNCENNGQMKTQAELFSVVETFWMEGEMLEAENVLQNPEKEVQQTWMTENLQLTDRWWRKVAACLENQSAVFHDGNESYKDFTSSTSVFFMDANQIVLRFYSVTFAARLLHKHQRICFFDREFICCWATCVIAAQIILSLRPYLNFIYFIVLDLLEKWKFRNRRGSVSFDFDVWQRELKAQLHDWVTAALNMIHWLFPLAMVSACQKWVLFSPACRENRSDRDSGRPSSRAGAGVLSQEQTASDWQPDTPLCMWELSF